MSVSGKLSEVLEMGLPGLVIFFFFFFKGQKKRKKGMQKEIDLCQLTCFILTHRPFLYSLYQYCSRVGHSGLNVLTLTAIIFYLPFYVNYTLCSLGVGEKRKILMFWKCHLFQTLFLSYAALHLHLCCQQACFPKQIQGKNRYAF